MPHGSYYNGRMTTKRNTHALQNPSQARDVLQDMKRWKLKMVSFAAPSTCRSITNGTSLSHLQQTAGSISSVTCIRINARIFVCRWVTGVYFFPGPLSTLSVTGFVFNKHTTLYRETLDTWVASALPSRALLRWNCNSGEEIFYFKLCSSAMRGYS